MIEPSEKLSSPHSFYPQRYFNKHNLSEICCSSSFNLILFDNVVGVNLKLPRRTFTCCRDNDFSDKLNIFLFRYLFFLSFNFLQFVFSFLQFFASLVDSVVSFAVDFGLILVLHFSLFLSFSIFCIVLVNFEDVMSLSSESDVSQTKHLV